MSGHTHLSGIYFFRDEKGSPVKENYIVWSLTPGQ